MILKSSNDFDTPLPLCFSLISSAGEHQKAIWAFYCTLIYPDVSTIVLDNFLLHVPYSLFSVFVWGLCGFNDLGG
jgi:hypothetical protein